MICNNCGEQTSNDNLCDRCLEHWRETSGYYEKEREKVKDLGTLKAEATKELLEETKGKQYIISDKEHPYYGAIGEIIGCDYIGVLKKWKAKLKIKFELRNDIECYTDREQLKEM